MRQFIAIVVVAMLAAASGCAAGDGDDQIVVVGTDHVKHHLLGSEKFGFNVNIVSSRPIDSVEFIGFEGENVQAIAVDTQDDTYDEVSTLRHRGKHLRIQGFVIESAAEYVRFDSVTLSIDGQEATYPFATPVQHRTGEGTEDETLYPTTTPWFISSQSLGGSEFPYEFHTDGPVTVTSLEFNDLLRFDIQDVRVDGRSVGTDHSVFPLDLEADSALEIITELAFADGVSGTLLDSVYATGLLTYTTPGSPTEHRILLSVTSQSVSNTEDAAAYIDLVLPE